MFGTDGIRGAYGVEPITPTTFYAIGKAIGKMIGAPQAVYIAHDGRNSADSLFKGLVAGLNSMSIETYLCGLLPTPVLAALACDNKKYAVMITASHNPAHDNGIKLFNPDGTKWSTTQQLRLEELVTKNRVPNDNVPSYKLFDKEAAKIYKTQIDKIQQSQAIDLSEMHVVLDCANGATSKLAPLVFSKLGAKVTTIHNNYKECEINKACGSTKPQALQNAVVEHKADLGLAFDGDGDRLIAVDHTGIVLDGDDILYIFAVFNKERKVVTTHMANTGLDKALNTKNIDVKRVDVGDRHIHKALAEEKLTIGAEPSGHIIHTAYSQSGDGIIAGILLMDIVKKEKISLLAWREQWQRNPYKLVNLSKNNHPDENKWAESVKNFQQQHADIKVLLRASKTEPLWRLLVEADTQDAVNNTLKILCESYHAI